MPEDKGQDQGRSVDPEDTTEEGLQFYNPALVGSGTITDDGTYGPPEPDPTLVRGLGPDKTSGGRRVLGMDPDAVRPTDVRQGEHEKISAQRKTDVESGKTGTGSSGRGK
jgi:hypothetical protein